MTCRTNDRCFSIATCVFAAVAIAATACLSAGERTKVSVKSTADGTDQPCYVILPDGFDAAGEPVPLVVSLHTWSGNVEQRNLPLEQLVDQRGWIYLFPHFRGPNSHPDACGSAKAQQDILDAVDWARNTYPIDPKRIYLTGVSGGGHMTMQMAGCHPDIWAAASAWVGISDLAAWHERHAKSGYGKMCRSSCGGAPGDSGEVDRQYRERSPMTHLHRAKDVPLEIAAGVHDGHKGSVPVRHSLDAFNTIARAAEATPISEEEILQLSRKEGRLDSPLPSDQVDDPSFGRKIYLRRTAGPARVTIFEGGHEGIAAAAIAWLERHQKP
ncbi:MAG: prolyl oligopeptidase family serine peptidase [Planctomycetes bacterium]|nr:prolyl oligopeptidase family serine peptidase [Planctomycetota bacterium]